MLDEKIVDKSKSLQQYDIFHSLPQHEIESLAHLAQVQTYHPKEFIFVQGDPADSLFVLIDGYVKLSRLNPDGEQKVIRLCGPGETFGEVLFTEG